MDISFVQPECVVFIFQKLRSACFHFLPGTVLFSAKNQQLVSQGSFGPDFCSVGYFNNGH